MNINIITEELQKYKNNRKVIFDRGPYCFYNDNQQKEIQYNDIFNNINKIYYVYPSLDNSKEYCFNSKEELAKYIYYIELQNTIDKSNNEIINYIDNIYTSDYLNNFISNLQFPLDDRFAFFEREGGDNGLMHRAHPSIYDARVTTLSRSRMLSATPRELWTNKKIMRYMCLNRLYYIGICTPRKIFKGYTIARISKKVSIFPVTTANRLISTYLNDANEIFDPFSGYSGRLLGAILNNKKYIGHDINKITVEESNELLDAIKQYQINPTNNPYKVPDWYRDIIIDPNTSVSVQDIFTDTNHEYESLFTCSPYANEHGIPKESWNYHYDESSGKYISDDSGYNTEQWIDYILDKYKCKKYLFVVDYMGKYSKYEVDDIRNKSHFNTNFEHVLLIER